MESWVEDIEFERLSIPARIAKKLLINPLANYLPAAMVKGLLRICKSELALSNWRDPGGWRSMVISYDGNPEKGIDKMLVTSGSIPTALRNRRRLASRLIARLIDHAPHEPAHVLCLGAGPGTIITDAMGQAEHDSVATLVDISSDAFDYGRRQAAERGLSERVRFIQGDVRDVKGMLDKQVDLVKMVGICEYLEDEQITSIARAVAEVMPAGTSIVFNSISKRHGTDRFFRRVFGLHMIHRSPQQLQELLEPVGFGEFTVFAEPLGVYNIVVCKRLAAPAAETGNNTPKEAE
ncbi:MAG: class I SAM-dependent methyltransferase [Phycisphaerae bacterium]|nr:class I SAM-dependent methyltransferase [Phycisphaerae bacterium]